MSVGADYFNWNGVLGCNADHVEFYTYWNVSKPDEFEDVQIAPFTSASRIRIDGRSVYRRGLGEAPPGGMIMYLTVSNLQDYNVTFYMNVIRIPAIS